MRCNLRCTMCPWSEMRSPRADMAWATYQNIAASFKTVEEIDLTGGGEPLMHPQILEMIGVAKTSGCKVGFSTNATFLTPKKSRELIEAGIDWIAYSVDGASAQTYEKIRRGAKFDCVIDQLLFFEQLRRREQSAHPLTMLFFVMMPENFHELPDLVKLCLHLGIDRLVVKNQDVILKMERDKERLFTWGCRKSEALQRIIDRSLKKAKSSGLAMRVYDVFPKEMAICEQDPLNTVFFNWEGYVSPCITMAYARKRVFRGELREAPILRFGNIQEKSLEEIWSLPGYKEFRGYYEKRNKRLGLKYSNLFSPLPFPPSPEGYETCHYLYGV